MLCMSTEIQQKKYYYEMEVTYNFKIFTTQCSFKLNLPFKISLENKKLPTQPTIYIIQS